jgi:hypothetical protein
MRRKPPGMLAYEARHLRKINSLREADSQPDIYTVPILDKASVLFTTASDMNNEPASCFNCVFHNADAKTCKLIGAHIIIDKITWPPVADAVSKPVEYWPCCSKHEFGKEAVEEGYVAADDPSAIGLVWINAPKVGLAYSGATCGGQNGGDDCDYYQTEDDNKRGPSRGFCRVLQCSVGGGDVCAAWQDDDQISWTDAQALFAKRDHPEAQADGYKETEEIAHDYDDETRAD